MRASEDTQIGRKEADCSDCHCRCEIPANDVHVDFGARQGGQQDRPKACEVIDPLCQFKVDEIAGHRADDDLEQRDGNRDPRLHRRRDQREPDPQR